MISQIKKLSVIAFYLLYPICCIVNIICLHKHVGELGKKYAVWEWLLIETICWVILVGLVFWDVFKFAQMGYTSFNRSRVDLNIFMIISTPLDIWAIVILAVLPAGHLIKIYLFNFILILFTKCWFGIATFIHCKHNSYILEV